MADDKTSADDDARRKLQEWTGQVVKGEVASLREELLKELAALRTQQSSSPAAAKAPADAPAKPPKNFLQHLLGS